MILGIKLAIICWILCQQLLSVTMKFKPELITYVCDKCITYWLSLAYCLLILPIGLNTLFIPALASIITMLINKLDAIQ